MPFATPIFEYQELYGTYTRIPPYLLSNPLSIPFDLISGVLHFAHTPILLNFNLATLENPVVYTLS
jgi:hypothetical protein